MAKTNDSVSDKFQNGLDQLTLERLTTLSEATEVQDSMQLLLQEETRRIGRKLGEQDPRTQQLSARLQANLELGHTLKLERQLMQIKVPEVAEKGTLIHGRIVDEDELGIDRLTVCLVDHSGTPTREIGEPTSNGSGYFAIPLEPEVVERLIKRHPDGVFLAVLTPRRRPVHQEPKPLALANGARLLVEIRLRRADLTTVPSPLPTALVVPNLVDMTESDALTALQDAGLKFGHRKTKVSPDQVGRVLDQSPGAGTKVAPGSSVSLVIGIAKKVNVPKVVDLKEEAARAKIKNSQLIVGSVTGRPDPKVSIVLKQGPGANEEVPIGTAINLVVGRRDDQGIRTTIIERMAKDATFKQVEVSLQDLNQRLENLGVETKEEFGKLVKQENRKLQKDLKLRTLRSTQAFKRIMKKALKDFNASLRGGTKSGKG